MDARLTFLMVSIFAWHSLPWELRAQRDVEFFETKIRPLLAEHCWECHSGGLQEGDLRLDSRAALLKGGESGPAVVLGKPQDSLLIAAVGYQEELQMPPQEPLSTEDVRLLAKWVAAGVPWGKPALPDSLNSAETHWAFQPVTAPRIPQVNDLNWPCNSIDHFILARQEDAGLRPSPPASKLRWLRRVSFDLRGLPPLPSEIRQFLSDESEGAYELLVDRMLSSPAFGERWGRHWLDVARYADNKGYVFFESKDYPWAYTYRDYVIEALNEDKPYDQFVVEQLAADQLEKDDSALRALGFLTLGGHFMNNTHDIIDDRIDVVTRGIMGISLTCARCHDHKYDPIPQTDYYSLYGVFRNSYEPILPPLYETPPDTEAHQTFAAEMEKRHQALVDFVTARHQGLVQDARTRIKDYLLRAQARYGLPPADDFMLLVEKGDLNPAMVLRWQTHLENPTRLQAVWAPWRARMSWDQQAWDRAPATPTDATEPVNPLVLAALESRPPQSMEDLAQLYADLLLEVNAEWQQLVADATAQSSEPPSSLPDPAREELRKVLYGPDSPADAPLMMDWGFLSLFPDRPTQGEYKKLLGAVEEWASQGANAPPRAMVLLDAPQTIVTRVFLRGNPNRLGAPVTRHAPGLLDPDRKPFQQGSGRLELAREIVATRNPLTARVIVNRIWKHYFGQGLVATPSDFGLRSDPPSHPALLDHLASELVAHGWSLKWLHRKILTSAVYRQSALPGSVTSDPQNRLLSRMNRRRLEYEAWRDAVLSVSTEMESQMYGPAQLMFEPGKESGRRSIYGFVNRMDVSSLLTTFDFPNPAATSPQRETTTVPPQALYMMNNPFVLKHSERAAQRFLQDSNPQVETVLEEIFLTCLGRYPTASELHLGQEFLGAQLSVERLAQLVQVLLMGNEFCFLD